MLARFHFKQENCLNIFWLTSMKFFCSKFVASFQLFMTCQNFNNTTLFLIRYAHRNQTLWTGKAADRAAYDFHTYRKDKRTSGVCVCVRGSREEREECWLRAFILTNWSASPTGAVQWGCPTRDRNVCQNEQWVNFIHMFFPEPEGALYSRTCKQNVVPTNKSIPLSARCSLPHLPHTYITGYRVSAGQQIMAQFVI